MAHSRQKPRTSKTSGARLLTVITIAAIATTLAMAAGCSQTGSSTSSETKPTSSESNAYRLEKLFAMEPAALADYLESQGIAFSNMDDLPDALKSADAEPAEMIPETYANTWCDATVRNLARHLDNPDSESELHAAVAAAAQDGYFYHIAITSRDSLDAVLNDSFPTPAETNMNAVAISASYKLGPQQLRECDSYYSLGIGFTPVELLTGGSRETPSSDEMKGVLLEQIDRVGLPAPVETAVLEHNMSSGIRFALACGFFESGGRECFYIARLSPDGSGVVAAVTLEDAYAEAGVNDKDALIEKNLSLGGSFNRVE